MYRMLFTSAICLICSIVFPGNAGAQLSWFGFSDLCFEGKFKAGGSVKNGELTITITGFTIQVRCFNTQSGESCQPGQGNAGNIQLTVPASADPTKERGVIFANGCISLAPWDDHGSNGHEHLCHPLGNPNKEEHRGSAHVTQIHTEWELTNTNNAGVTKVIKSGFQTCNWGGSFNENTCEPAHGVPFVCPIDEELK